MASKDRSNKKRTSGEVVSDVQDDVNNEQVEVQNTVDASTDEQSSEQGRLSKWVGGIVSDVGSRLAEREELQKIKSEAKSKRQSEVDAQSKKVKRAEAAIQGKYEGETSKLQQVKDTLTRNRPLDNMEITDVSSPETEVSIPDDSLDAAVDMDDVAMSKYRMSDADIIDGDADTDTMVLDDGTVVSYKDLTAENKAKRDKVKATIKSYTGNLKSNITGVTSQLTDASSDMLSNLAESNAINFADEEASRQRNADRLAKSMAKSTYPSKSTYGRSTYKKYNTKYNKYAKYRYTGYPGYDDDYDDDYDDYDDDVNTAKLPLKTTKRTIGTGEIKTLGITSKPTLIATDKQNTISIGPRTTFQTGESRFSLGTAKQTIIPQNNATRTIGTRTTEAPNIQVKQFGSTQPRQASPFASRIPPSVQLGTQSRIPVGIAPKTVGSPFGNREQSSLFGNRELVPVFSPRTVVFGNNRVGVSSIFGTRREISFGNLANSVFGSRDVSRSSPFQSSQSTENSVFRRTQGSPFARRQVIAESVNTPQSQVNVQPQNKAQAKTKSKRRL